MASGSSKSFHQHKNYLIHVKLLTDFLAYIVAGGISYLIFTITFKKKFPSLPSVFFLLTVILALLTNGMAVATMVIDGVSKNGKAISFILVWGTRFSLLLLGYGASWVLSTRESSRRTDHPVDQPAAFLIRGISIALGLSFTTVAIEQTRDIVAIRQFFLLAGYSVGFMYLIFVLEGLCGLLLLFNLPYYVKVATIFVLLCIMIGAVISHIKKGDPFPYAVPASENAIKALILLLVYLHSYSIINKSHDTQRS